MIYVNEFYTLSPKLPTNINELRKAQGLPNLDVITEIRGQTFGEGCDRCIFPQTIKFNNLTQCDSYIYPMMVNRNYVLHFNDYRN